MISEAELRRLAARWGVDPMVVDLDYGLGWFIAAFYGANEPAEQLYFKGGTCLRKCYFGDYRFSEDLDFTATAWLTADRLLDWVGRATRWASEEAGVPGKVTPSALRWTYAVREMRSEVALTLTGQAGQALPGQADDLLRRRLGLAPMAWKEVKERLSPLVVTL